MPAAAFEVTPGPLQQFLREHPDLAARIEAKLRAKFGLPAVGTPAATDAEEQKAEPAKTDAKRGARAT